MMIDTVRGVLRVRKWPKKYGKPRSASQAYWVDWFKQANLLAKYADAMSQRRAIEMTKGSGLYPRDVLLKAMRGRLYWWIDDTGWKWYPMAGISDISGALDVLAQTVGDVLVRATDRWRPPPPGVAGDVLTNQGPGTPPEWAAGGGGGGGALGALLTLSANPVIPNATFTALIWGTEQYDDNDFVDLAANPTRFTAPAGATFARVTFNATWQSNNNGERILTVYKNGAAVPAGGWVRQGAAGALGQNIVTGKIPWEAGDYLECMVYQSSGANRSMESTSTSRTWACLESWSA